MEGLCAPTLGFAFYFTILGFYLAAVKTIDGQSEQGSTPSWEWGAAEQGKQESKNCWHKTIEEEEEENH